MLSKVKKALRINNTAFDDEIQDLIDAAKEDLATGGVKNTDDTDQLVKMAIIFFAKANFGMANPEMEKYQKAYDRLKITMALTEKYRTSGVTNNV